MRSRPCLLVVIQHDRGSLAAGSIQPHIGFRLWGPAVFMEDLHGRFIRLQNVLQQVPAELVVERVKPSWAAYTTQLAIVWREIGTPNRAHSCSWRYRGNPNVYFWWRMCPSTEGEAKLPGWTDRGIGAVTTGVVSASRSQPRQA